MTEAALALARARTCGWISEVVLDGWTPRALEVAAGLEWLDLPHDAERRAARHHRVFGQGIPPYESVFLDPQGQLGGSCSEAVRQAYRRFGFQSTRTDVEPDHLGVQCAALCFLYGAEADALRDGVDAAAIVELRASFVDAHLGRWVGALAVAVAAHEVHELTGLVELLVELLGGTRVLEGTPETLLEAENTGLKQVCRYLTRPARCGAWLSVRDIQIVARRAELACGFGPRVKMLESLWFSAVDHQRLPRLVESLQMQLEPWSEVGGPCLRATHSMLVDLAAGAPVETG